MRISPWSGGRTGKAAVPTPPGGLVRRAVVRPVLLIPLILASALPALPAPMAAQTEPPTGHRKWLYGAIGGVLVGVPAYMSADFGVGGCGSRNCFAPIAATAGALAGFLIGLDRDREAARRWVAGPTADLESSAFEVPLPPDHMARIPGGVALLGEAGLARANGDAGVTSTHAARGLLAAVVLEEHEALLAASAQTVLAFDQDGAIRGARRAFGSGGSALAGDGGSRLVLGGEGTLRLLSVEGTGNAVTVTEELVATEGTPARSVAWTENGGVIWELAGSRVVSRSASTLEIMGSLDLPGPGRRVALSGEVAVVAGGESGVSIVSIADPRRPELASVYEGVRYAFDADISGGTAYVAAGEQGLVVLDLADAEAPRVTAVVGNLGEPYAVVRNAGNLFVLDRDDRRLHVIRLEDGGATRPR